MTGIFFFLGGEGLIFGCKIHYIMRFLKLNYKLGCKPVFYPTPTMAEKSSLGRPKLEYCSLFGPYFFNFVLLKKKIMVKRRIFNNPCKLVAVLMGCQIVYQFIERTIWSLF